MISCNQDKHLLIIVYYIIITVGTKLQNGNIV